MIVFISILIFGVIIFFLSISLKKKPVKSPSLYSFTPLKIGHRGASGYRPENTMASYSKAVEMGVDYIEIDIHLSKDGELIVLHDPTLERTTNGKGNVRDQLVSELLELDAGGWFHPEYKGARMPLLSEVLDRFLPITGILIEIKHPSLYPGIERKLTEELQHRNVSLLRDKPVMVHSFDRESMEKFHQYCPKVPVGVLMKQRPSDHELLEMAEYASFINPKHTILSPALTAKIHRHGMKVFTWTVNNKKRMTDIQNMKIDGIISDYPDLFNS